MDILSEHIPNAKLFSNNITTSFIAREGKILKDLLENLLLSDKLAPHLLKDISKTISESQSNKLIIFDDLERSGIDLKEVMGMINEFVEHLDFKVIILAHEGKLTDMNIMEKTIGKIFTLESDIDSVYDIFIAEQEEATKAFKNNEKLTTELTNTLKDNKELIVEIFKKSGFNNLRTLKQIFSDFTFLYSLLDEKIKKKTALITDLIKYFFIYSIENKNDHDSFKEIFNGINMNIEIPSIFHNKEDYMNMKDLLELQRIFDENNGKEYNDKIEPHKDNKKKEYKKKIETMINKYPMYHGSDLLSQNKLHHYCHLLSYNQWRDIILNNIYQKDDINLSLKKSTYFIKDLMIFLNHEYYTSNEYRKSLENVVSKFREYKYGIKDTIKISRKLFMDNQLKCNTGINNNDITDIAKKY